MLGGLPGQQHALGPPAKNATLLIFARESFTEQLTARAAEEHVQLLAAAVLFTS